MNTRVRNIVGLLLISWWITGASSFGDAPTERNGRFLYVMTPGIRNLLEYGGAGILVFDIGNGHQLVRRINTPASLEAKPENIKGVCASQAKQSLYFTTLTKLTRFDLISEESLWSKELEGGCDRLAITPDGSKLYVPSLEGDFWNVVAADTGNVITRIEPKSGAHNTLVSLDGSRAYLAGLKSPLLMVVDTRADKPLGVLGPFSQSIRPFTLNGSGTLCFVNVNDLLGFEVGDLRVAKSVARVEVKSFANGPVARHGCPSHGIALSPDEKEIWLCDAHNRRLHVFDVTQYPPRQVADVEVRDEPGWVCFSIDGDFVYPSTGDVIDPKTKRIVARLTDEEGRAVGSEKMLEIDFSRDKSTRVGNQFGMGRLPQSPYLPPLPKKEPSKTPKRPRR